MSRGHRDPEAAKRHAERRERKRLERREQRQKLEAEAATAAPKPSTPTQSTGETKNRTSDARQAAAQRITVGFPDARMLVAVGAPISASWSVSGPLANQLQARGLPIPPPVHGVLILDTGAYETCIASHVALTLGLTPIGKTSVGGAHGVQSSDVYLARCSVFFPAGPVIRDIPSAAVKEMELGRPIETDGGQRVPVIGLLGRDFLSFCRVVYHGPSGLVTIDLIPPRPTSPPSPTRRP